MKEKREGLGVGKSVSHLAGLRVKLKPSGGELTGGGSGGTEGKGGR